MHRYWVYVIEETRRGETSLYVGSSAKSPRQRLQEHRDGHSYCESCGNKKIIRGRLRLRQDLMPERTFTSREAAERVERRTAASLKHRGFSVKGGH
jgi:predicted GIY-YIG superfamily endonuclease